MNKNALKTFAIWARVQLMEAVKLKAYEYGIDETGYGEEKATVLNGKALSNAEAEQRAELVTQIKRKGFNQVVEEVAYTWFNRFIALRYMEVNGYLPTRIRVFSDESGAFDPEILKQATNIELEGIDKNTIYDFIDKQDNEGLFKYLVIAQCNTLNHNLPGMFEKINNYTELLFPNKLLADGSVAEQMVSTIPEEDWKDQVQIIGWLYQFYNSELKDETYAQLAKKVKLTKEKIPAVTQLFTPDWIVRYMVENSLGRLWYEGHPDDSIKAEWKYYLDEAEQEKEVQKQLDEIKAEYAKIKPEDIKIIDPCMGSGHILVYAFDVLMQIYLSQGWNERDAAKSIVENNLYGIDIDDRAYQLAYFAVMMKARSYSRRILNQNVKYNLCAITDSNEFNEDYLELFGTLKNSAKRVIDEFRDAKEYGSILNVKTELTYLYALQEKVEEIKETEYDNFFDNARRGGLIAEFEPILKEAIALAQKYDVVVTNPPYMSSRGMPDKLKSMISRCYPEGKGDLFAVFIIQGLSLCKKNRIISMITMQSLMFLSTYSETRGLMLNYSFNSMLQIGFNSFPELNSQVAHAQAFTLTKSDFPKFKGCFYNLNTGKVSDDKHKVFINKLNKDYYICNSEDFKNLPNSVFAYWLTESEKDSFKSAPRLETLLEIKQGLATGNNDTYLRMWHEIEYSKINFVATDIESFQESGKLYAPYNKGGNFRKWYGNKENLIKFDKYNYSNLLTVGNHLPSRDYYFRKGITWSLIGNDNFAARISDGGFVFDVGGSSGFPVLEKDLTYILALLCSKVAVRCLHALNPTINFQVGDIKNIPVVEYNGLSQERISNISETSISLSKTDWDSFETSWDFEMHPLVAINNDLWDATAIGATMHHYYGNNPPKHDSPLELCYLLWQGQCNERFNQLKANEEELNRIFIDIYGLQDELTPEVEDKDVTVRKADLQRDIKSLLSYAVGCIFGRYSVNTLGLAYAGGEWDSRKYEDFIPDADNVIPICDDEYFEDDLTNKVIDFIKVVFGEDSLESNLSFIASALGGKGTPREVLRKYFLNDFYKDHLKIYQKRPIYWQFDSGKKNGFKCLIYMHRYTPDLIAKIRTDYVFEQQERYRTQIGNLEVEINSASTSERVKLSKQLQKLKDQLHEITQYEEKVHHLADQMIAIDLDDGVKVNYAKFGDLLATIK